MNQWDQFLLDWHVYQRQIKVVSHLKTAIYGIYTSDVVHIQKHFKSLNYFIKWTFSKTYVIITINIIESTIKPTVESGSVQNENNIVLSVVLEKILIWLVQMLLKNLKCALVEFSSKLCNPNMAYLTKNIALKAHKVQTT